MEYFISFLEGIITFVSPCLLPMIPLYVTYFAAGEDVAVSRVVKNALGFVLGFTIVFIALGALAGTLGALLIRYQVVVNIVCGAVVVFFGLSFLGIIKINLFHGASNALAGRTLGFFSAIAFGIIFSVGWTPCVGAFLGSALLLASTQGSVGIGVLMLFCYSIGLGIPFVLAAILIDKLKETFDVIKRHYGIITKVCGWFLV
ncbi:MAG: cytochrome c biogenesis CcdA family protein, partial [Eggerthellaceae bacterium]|nr:cytochrome c biogenesis CcdA family protein [Eggerthellaceae bacterium]